MPQTLPRRTTELLNRRNVHGTALNLIFGKSGNMYKLNLCDIYQELGPEINPGPQMYRREPARSEGWARTDVGPCGFPAPRCVESIFLTPVKLITR